MRKEILDLYTDYLISSFSYTTATWLSNMLDWSVSHDKITRFLSETDFESKDLWELVKPIVRDIEDEDWVITFDDSIEEKRYTDQNEIITWHFDHTVGRSVKWVNFLTCLYSSSKANIPISVHIIKKDTRFTDSKTHKEMMVSAKTKNEIMREMFLQSIKNGIIFKYVLWDIWFWCSETMEVIRENKKHFIFAIKSNRTVSLEKGRPFKKIKELEFQDKTPIKAYLKGIDFPVLLVKQVFTNKDGSTGELYLACSDLTLGFDEISNIYHKRWNIEVYHKSLKSNTGFSKSPGKTVRTQNNHFFASIFAYVKLECLFMKTKVNHFALKSRIYIKALQSAFSALKELSA